MESRTLRPQDDLERGAEARCAADAEAALDRRCAVAHVPQSLTGHRHLGRKAFTVVLDRHEPLPRRALADHDLGPCRVRVAADIAETLLDDAEDLDLLV